MKTISFSTHKQLNALLNSIYVDLLSICDTKEASRAEIARYVREFGRTESDCNLVQYGNLLIYYYQVRDFYVSHGYKWESEKTHSDQEIWATYMRQVGYVAREIAGGRI